METGQEEGEESKEENSYGEGWRDMHVENINIGWSKKKKVGG